MQKFLSKKLLVALSVFVLEIAKGCGWALPSDSEATILFVALAYLSGQSFVDAVLASKSKK